MYFILHINRTYTGMLMLPFFFKPHAIISTSPFIKLNLQWKSSGEVGQRVFLVKAPT